MKKRRHLLRWLAVILIVLTVWTVWENCTVGLTKITVIENDLPQAFDSLKIAHVSDLHNSWLWEKALAQLRTAKPDIICMTGDMVDFNRMDVQLGLTFAQEAVKIAPCYYIPGNHELEMDTQTYRNWIQSLKALGVTVLEDREVVLTYGGQQISITGLALMPSKNLGNLSEFDGYRILLAHQPEYFSDYYAADFDLVLSGHAHGGQFRLPVIGGLYSPNQGVLPEYDSGLFSSGDTDMYVSRGIGNSRFPFRFNNRPEVILITLKCG